MTHWIIGGKSDRQHNQETTKMLGKFYSKCLKESRPYQQNILQSAETMRPWGSNHVFPSQSSTRVVLPGSGHFIWAGSKLCWCGKQKVFVRVSKGRMDLSNPPKESHSPLRRNPKEILITTATWVTSWILWNQVFRCLTAKWSIFFTFAYKRRCLWGFQG